MQNLDKYFILFAGSTAMLILAMGIVLLFALHQKKLLGQKQAQQLLELDYKTELLYSNLKTQEDERARIAADLHDEIGSSLATLRMQLATMGRQPQNINTPGFASAKEIIDNTIDSIKRISYDLLPPGLNDFGLEHVVNKLFETIRKNTGFEVVCDIPVRLGRYGNTRELALFRIIQELVNNSIKHSDGTQICLGLFEADGILSLTYCDDGRGYHFESMEKSAGLGLKNIKSRASLIGAEVVASLPNGLVITLPIKDEV